MKVVVFYRTLIDVINVASRIVIPPPGMADYDKRELNIAEQVKHLLRVEASYKHPCIAVCLPSSLAVGWYVDDAAAVLFMGDFDQSHKEQALGRFRPGVEVTPLYLTRNLRPFISSENYNRLIETLSLSPSNWFEVYYQLTENLDD